MGDQHARRNRQAQRESRPRDAGRGAAYDHIGRGQRVEIHHQLAFHLHAFEHRLLHIGHAFHGLGQRGNRRDAGQRRGGVFVDQPVPLQTGQLCCDKRHGLARDLGIGVEHLDVQAGTGKDDGPAGAYQTGADDCYRAAGAERLDVGGIGHVVLRLLLCGVAHAYGAALNQHAGHIHAARHDLSADLLEQQGPRGIHHLFHVLLHGGQVE
ncbi:hypothetical protein D3C72_981920 [compost metagenome]